MSLVSWSNYFHRICPHSTAVHWLSRRENNKHWFFFIRSKISVLNIYIYIDLLIFHTKIHTIKYIRWIEKWMRFFWNKKKSHLLLTSGEWKLSHRLKCVAHTFRVCHYFCHIHSSRHLFEMNQSGFRCRLLHHFQCSNCFLSYSSNDTRFYDNDNNRTSNGRQQQQHNEPTCAIP